MEDFFDNLLRIIVFIVIFAAVVYLLPVLITYGFYFLIAYFLYKIIWNKFN